MKIKRNLALSDTGFVFNPASGDSFSVNPIGLEILNLLKEGKVEGEIKRTLTERYQSDADQVEKDYYDFIKMLETFQLTEGHDETKN